MISFGIKINCVQIDIRTNGVQRDLPLPRLHRLIRRLEFEFRVVLIDGGRLTLITFWWIHNTLQPIVENSQRSRIELVTTSFD